MYNMINVPTEIRPGKWMPCIAGENGENAIWADQTVCDSKEEAERHGEAMLRAYIRGIMAAHAQIKKLIKNNAPTYEESWPRTPR